MFLHHPLLRPQLFQLDPETAHHGAVEACHWLGAMPEGCSNRRAREM
jgi:hypothetical protein